MRTFLIILISMGAFMILPNHSLAQIQYDSTKVYLIVKHDGGEIVGNIISSDERELKIRTQKFGIMIIPKHTIKEIKELKANQVSESGEYLAADVFATRYFLTTNGFPLQKGDSYIQWNLFGPDFQHGISDRFGMGIMTSWIAIPIIGTMKYSFPIKDNINLGIGTLVGTLSYGGLGDGGVLPFASLTLGSRQKNISFTGGFINLFSDFESNYSSALFSVAGMIQISPKVNFVFDSFIVPGSSDSGTLAIFSPGLRLHIKRNNAFQFGFAGAYYDEYFLPVPIPLVQWFTRF